MNTVAVTRTPSYEQAGVKEAVKRHFDLLGLQETLRPGMRVLLKPNLLMKRKPEEATTTHPAVLEEIILCLQELGITDITLADSPGGPYTKLALQGIYDASGMTALAERTGIKLNWDFGNYVKPVENGKVVSSFPLINPIADADVIINVAKLKTHAMTTLSGAVKNLFGTVPGLMKPELHLRFPEPDAFGNMLVDLCETVKPQISFVDAIVSMEGDGPSGGTPRNTGLLLSARSPYAMDQVLCRIIGIEPEQACMLKAAMERGLTVTPELVGDPLPTVSDYQLPHSASLQFSDHVPKFLKKPTEAIFRRFFTSHPKIKTAKCIGCGKCAEICPVQTITITDKKAKIAADKCIRCFCCHEMCPIKAIEIKRSRLFNL